MISDFTWQLFSIMLHCVVSYLERFQFFFLYLIPFVAMRTESARALCFIVVTYTPSLSVIRETKSMSLSTDCHVPGITYTASVTINHLS